MTQLANAIAYAACYQAHKAHCTGRPLNRRDFAVLMAAAGIAAFVRAYDCPPPVVIPDVGTLKGPFPFT